MSYLNIEKTDHGYMVTTKFGSVEYTAKDPQFWDIDRMYWPIKAHAGARAEEMARRVEVEAEEPSIGQVLGVQFE